MRSRMLVTALTVAGLLAALPAVTAGSPDALDGKVWKVVDKVESSLEKGDANFGKWLDWASAQVSKPGGCDKADKVYDKLMDKVDKQYDKLHSVIHKAREQLDKLEAQGASPDQITAAHNAITALWYNYWDQEAEFIALLNALLSGCF